MGELRMGVIGTGHMGRYHVNVLNSIKKIHFVGVYDSNQELSQKVGMEYGVSSFVSFDKFINSVDAVVLAVPTSKHYQLGRQILLSGKHLLIEKPITNVLSQAKELITIAKEKKLKMLVGHVERYNAAVQELEKIIANPYVWESRRISSNDGRNFDVGVALDLLIHDIDIALRIIKSDVVSISAQALTLLSDFEDVLQCQIKFKNGCLAYFIVSRIHHRKERMLRITEKDFDLSLDFSTQDIFIYRGGKSVIETQKERISYRQQSTVERVFIHKGNPLQLELEDFILSIEEDLPVDNDLDFKTLAISMEVIDLIQKPADHSR